LAVARDAIDISFKEFNESKELNESKESNESLSSLSSLSSLNSLHSLPYLTKKTGCISHPVYILLSSCYYKPSGKPLIVTTNSPTDW
jgi:hypothetical protein